MKRKWNNKLSSNSNIVKYNKLYIKYKCTLITYIKYTRKFNLNNFFFIIVINNKPRISLKINWRSVLHIILKISVFYLQTRNIKSIIMLAKCIKIVLTNFRKYIKQDKNFNHFNFAVIIFFLLFFTFLFNFISR